MHLPGRGGYRTPQMVDSYQEGVNDLTLDDYGGMGYGKNNQSYRKR